jgi:predicted nucleic acid-binding Zn ribbon protein
MEDMDRIGGPLKDLLARLRLSEPMMGWQAVELWPEVVGERAAAHSRALSFRDGPLVVEVDSSTWMNELTYLKRRVIEELNRRLDGEIVHDVRMQPVVASRSEQTHRPGK